MSAVDEISAKSSPDIQKLQAMGTRRLSVTKLIAKGSGIPVFVGKPQASMEEILGMHESLLRTPGAGAGTYKFEVFEEGGPSTDRWVIKIGPDPVTPEAPYMTTSSPPNGSGSSAPIAGEAAYQLGHGYMYNETLGLLTTPQRQIFAWKPGDPLPGQLDVGGRLPAAPATSTFGQLALGGLSAYPSLGEDKREARETRERLRLAEERAKAAEERAQREAEETRRRDEMRELRETLARQAEEGIRRAEETNRRFETLITKLTEKPSGPTPMELDQQRKLEALERAQEQNRRDENHAREMAAAQTRHEQLLREMQDAKPDPMTPMIAQMMQMQQASTQAMVAAIQSVSAEQVRSGEKHMQVLSERLGGSVLTPERLMDVLKMAKDRGPEAAATQGMIDMFKSTFAMAQDVVRMQGELYSSQQGPAWVGMAQQAADQIGSVAKSYFTHKAASEGKIAEEEARTKRTLADAAKAREQRLLAQASQVTAQSTGLGGVTVGAPVAAAPTAAPTTSQGVRARAAAQVEARQPRQPTPVPAQAADAGEEEDEPADASAKQQIDLTKLTSTEVRGLITNSPMAEDEAFFEGAVSSVGELRNAALKGLKPDEAVNMILLARDYLRSIGQRPPAVELIESGHAIVTLERIFPGDDPNVDLYRKAIADAIHVRMRAEAAAAS